MECNNAIESLVGMPLSKIGRAADLLWLQFGTLREVTTRYGEKTIGDWAIHVPTSWRFVRDAQIILAVGDLYLLPDGETYDWDEGGDSNFDNITDKLNELFIETSVTVKRVHCDDVGGFSLTLSDGTRFDVFPKMSDTIDGIEHWRMFQPDGDGGHAVCQTQDKRANAG